MVLHNPAVRWGYALLSGITIAAVALFVLDGTAQLVALGIAVIDVVTTPLILKTVAENGQAEAV
ncbi:hypothetical protein [Natrinema versiforme]|uniref:Uncharacterized protein n=1 Tax=Natrinema versiforme TaxID=88724 RepID=A0A4V1FZG0_9EURY|nr:hypothetical protein [Natrinema versiforme]QCS41716.1 hypothetical protein FEJ81_04860 [Natrinema versiforme]